MLSPFRTTKPTYPASTVDRPRLYERLDRWPAVRAVLVQAPAGFGKSSLVSRWLDVSDRTPQAVWLSLAEADSDPRTLVTSLAGALEGMTPGLLADIQPILDNARIPPQRAVEKLIATLWEAHGARGSAPPAQRLLVLDDLHLIVGSDAAPLLLALLEEGPPSLHYLLLARHAASLPLTRLYAGGHVVELTASDLRFTADEVRQFLLAYDLRSSPEELARIIQRTEGWIVALQLARHSQGGHSTMGEYLATLRGDSRWLARYLAQEVLAQQSPGLRDFLLRTAILDSFSAPLCAAVAGVNDAYRWLAELQRNDLFLIALDRDGVWFRYHHLFQELLKQRLLELEGKPAADALHRRAAAWLASHEQWLPAIGHLLEAGASDEAAALVESQMRTAIMANPVRAHQLFDALPAAVASRRPRIMLERCLVSLMENNKDLALRIQTAQRSLTEHPPSPAQMAVFETELCFYRTIAHYADGELELAAQLAERLQGERRHLDPLLMGVLDFLQMRLSAASADEAIQRQHARRALAAFKAADLVAGQIAVRRELAMMDVRAGRSAEAGREFERIVAAFGSDPSILRGELAWVHLYAAEHSYWQNDLERALHHIKAALNIASIFQEDDVNSHLARLHPLYAVKGQGCDAIREPDPPAGRSAPQFHLVDRQIRWLLAVDRTEEAWEAARDYQAGLAGDLLNLPYTHTIPYLRAYVARGIDLADIRPLLDHAIEDSVRARDLPKQLDLLAFAAWLELQTGQATAARAALAQAEALAIRTGYVRVLLDIPPLAALWEAERAIDDQTSGAASVEASSLLTAQEQAVLTLLAEDLTYEQIAQGLTVSINTVRTHVKNIYRKLAVRRRDQAIQRAQALGLVG